MSEKELKIGIDRFLALEWTDYALELFLSSKEEYLAYQKLREYLDHEISGKDASRKTANQLKRLWLSRGDVYQDLRKFVLSIPKPNDRDITPVFHLGMAINVFPLFQDTCRKIGLLERVNSSLPKQTVVDRVMETYANPSSIPRIVARVLQTLEDWKLINQQDSRISIVTKVITDKDCAAWFILAMIKANNLMEVALSEVNRLPGNLGIILPDVRQVLQNTPWLITTRNSQGIEVVRVR